MDMRRRSERRISAAAVLKMPPPPVAACCRQGKAQAHYTCQHKADLCPWNQISCICTCTPSKLLQELSALMRCIPSIGLERQNRAFLAIKLEHKKCEGKLTCSLSAAVFGRTPVKRPVSSRTGTVPRLLMLMLIPRPSGTAPALTGRLQHSKTPLLGIYRSSFRGPILGSKRES